MNGIEVEPIYLSLPCLQVLKSHLKALAPYDRDDPEGVIMETILEEVNRALQISLGQETTPEEAATKE